MAQAVAAEAARREQSVRIVRNGSRGAFWLEPLVEVQTAQGRIAYGPVRVKDVAGLFAAGFLEGKPHALGLGAVAEIPYLKNQERLCCTRMGVIDPLSLDDYRAHGGYAGLAAALAMAPADIVQAVTDSGLRGRGGAAFPTGIKWRTVLNAPATTAPPQKYIVCNADEGDSGTFSDRLIMEGDPFCLIEGMTIAGLARRRHARLHLSALRVSARARGTALGASHARTRRAIWAPTVQGSGKAFELEVRLGAGAYICGEETSLLESLEGRRGQVRFKPPLPAIAGLVWLPDRDQQRHHFRQRAHGAGARRGLLP